MSVRTKRGVALGPASLRGNRYRNVALADGALALWLLNEASGPVFADASGNSRAATISGTPTFSAPALGVGLSVEGTSTTFASGQQAATASGAWLNSLSGLSLEAWFKTTAAASQFALARDNAAVRCFHLDMNASGQLVFDLWNSAGALSQLTTPATYRDGNPHHVVMAADASAVTIYVDGVSRASAAGTTLATGSGSSEPVYIGNYSGGGFQWTGGLQALAIYGTALPVARVLAHYQAGV